MLDRNRRLVRLRGISRMSAIAPFSQRVVLFKLRLNMSFDDGMMQRYR
jgi:hypothetical protein